MAGLGFSFLVIIVVVALIFPSGFAHCFFCSFRLFFLKLVTKVLGRMFKI